MRTKQELVKAIEQVAGDRMVCLYTGRDTAAACAVDLASEMPMRCEWLYWNGNTAGCEPPIYVPVCTDPECFTWVLEGISHMCCDLGASLVSGDVESWYIPGTDRILSVDTGVSNDRVVLICIGEGYEELL